MRIFLSPQVSEDRIIYEFNGYIVKVTIDGITDTFDFSGLPIGSLELSNLDTGEDLIKTSLPVNPIISAEKKEGVLYLELLNWIPSDAPEEVRFPKWIVAQDYVAPELKEVIKDADENVMEESGAERPRTGARGDVAPVPRESR